MIPCYQVFGLWFCLDFPSLFSYALLFGIAGLLVWGMEK